jgi:uncharacterized protein (TIGR02246 family)
MNLAKWCACLALSVLAVACERESAEDERAEATITMQAVADSAKPALNAVLMQWTEGMTKGDPTMTAGTYASDAVSMGPNTEPVSGAAAIMDFQKAFLAAGTVTDVSAKTDELYPVPPDMILEFGSYALTLTPKGGKPAPDHGRYVNLWKKQSDGTWKVYRDMNVSSLPLPTK